MIAQLTSGLYWIASGVWFRERDQFGNLLKTFDPRQFDPMPRETSAARPRSRRADRRDAFFERSGPVANAAAAKALLRTMTGRG